MSQYQMATKKKFKATPGCINVQMYKACTQFSYTLIIIFSTGNTSEGTLTKRPIYRQRSG